MTLIDITSIVFSLLTIIVVLRLGRELKQLLTDARYERLDINRRLEKLGRRLDKIDGTHPAPADLDDDYSIQPATSAAT